MTPARTRLAGLVAAALAAAAGLVGLTSAPASAALCAGAGVNVVVDFNGLGGGVQKGCDPNGAGRSADRVFEAAGFNLTRVANSPGFVCRVEGKPSPSQEACANTPPANAYWGLFWSDGKSGRWTYATTGVNGLEVPNGGFVAFSWQGSESKDPPSASPVNAKPAPTKTPTPTPTKKPTPTRKAKPTSHAKPTRTATVATPTAVASSTARARARASATPSVTPSPRESASATPGSSASTSPDPTDTASAGPDVTGAVSPDNDFTPPAEQGGLPVWVPIAVIVALAGVAAGALWWRRRTGLP